jgi:hypothetical protein
MKLMEIMGHVNLTDNQKKVLVACIVSGTPQQAFEFTIGNTNLVTARNTLVNLGLLWVNDNQMGLTETGQQATQDYNLVDTNDELTQDAIDLLDGEQDSVSAETASQ